RAVKREEFTGKKDQTLEFTTNGALKPQRIVLLGLGNTSHLGEPEVRALAARGARYALGTRSMSVGIELPAGATGAERAAAEGAVLGAYRFARYLTGDRGPKTAIEKVVLITHGKASAEAKEAVELGQRVGEAVCIARDLINEPPNELYPEALAKAAAEVSKA